MRVLLSGFEPFGGHELNSSALLLSSFEQGEISHPSSMTVQTILLPVSFQESFEALQLRIQTFNPDIVISFGQASKRDSIEIESMAVNLIDTEMKDNQGMAPRGQVITPNGPGSYLSTLPIHGFEKSIAATGIPVKISNSAGTFVCNYLFYRLMETNQESLRLCGFIHMPLVPEQAAPGEPSMPLNDMKLALSSILRYVEY